MKYIPPLNWLPGDEADENRPHWNADPESGVPAERRGAQPSAIGFEAAQREIVSAITAAGLTPDPEDYTQLAAAIAAMVAAAAVTYASDAASNTGTATAAALTPANFGGQQLKAATGYQRLPGGLILQWGTGVAGTTAFPVAFPTACLNVVAVDESSASNTGIHNVGTDTYTTTNFGLRNSGGGGFISHWLAIGH